MWRRAQYLRQFSSEDESRLPGLPMHFSQHRCVNLWMSWFRTAFCCSCCGRKRARTAAAVSRGREVGRGWEEGGPGALAAGGQDTLLSPQGGFTVLFYGDFEGSLSDKNVQNALRHLQEISTFLRVLGSYPFDAGLGQ